MFATTRVNQVIPAGTGSRYPKERCRLSRFVRIRIFLAQLRKKNMHEWHWLTN